MGLERLSVERSNCGRNEDLARLFGLGELHYITTDGQLRSRNAIEIVSFVNSRFDPERGDTVLIEGRERGDRFEGPIEMYPFAEYVSGEGWDNMAMVRETLPILEERAGILQRLRQASGSSDLPALKKAADDWDKVHPVFIERSIIRRNIDCLAPSIKRTLSRMSESGKPNAKLYVVAGMAHWTEHPELYNTLNENTYNIYLDMAAPYLARRRSPHPA